MKNKIPFAPLLALALVAPAAAVNIDWAVIGNAGNAADPATGSIYGAVAYEYKISRNETTIAQYVEFLNAVAATDSYGLYNTHMATDVNVSGISRSGESGFYNYSVIGSGNRPITYVSWFDAARFSNWLHNGKPTGNQDASTTEDGAYTLNGATSGLGFTRNVGATVWIPSEDEWYKAAYYDPTKDSNTGGYWLQANQSNYLVSNIIGEEGAANYWVKGYTQERNNLFSRLTEVGVYGIDSQSFYGTNDQAGNVWEWNDAVIGTQRGLRGASFENMIADSSTRGSGDVDQHASSYGFRVAGIPEPSTALLTMLASGLIIFRRRQR